jgi:Na+-translocating ferredoxin:NAD+ oxidoreductase RnfD subunit
MWQRVDLVRGDGSEERIACSLLANSQCCSLLTDYFHHEEGGDAFLRNVGSHKTFTAFFVATAVKTSNPTGLLLLQVVPLLTLIRGL